MDELDKELVRIWKESNLERCINEIKAAFTEAGYTNTRGGTYTISPEPITSTPGAHFELQTEYMTGKEWFKRYRTEWNNIVATGDVHIDSHIEAARRASGIGEGE